MLAVTITLAALTAAVVYLSRKVSQLSSQEFDVLKADVLEAAKELAAKNAEIADLKAQLAAAHAAAGTSDSELAALDAELKGALDPAPAPVPVA